MWKQAFENIEGKGENVTSSFPFLAMFSNLPNTNYNIQVRIIVLSECSLVQNFVIW